MGHSLRGLLGISRGDVLSVVGSGGKTTFIYNLAKEIKSSKVLISTTTKMFYPKSDQVDRFFSLDCYKDFKAYNGLTFIADKIENNKVSCSDFDLLKGYFSLFDYVLLECDGSKRKPLKGWGIFEPVILKETTKTVGIIPMHVLSKEVSEDVVHRLEIFNSLFKVECKEKITLNLLADIITNPKGLFKNAVGERVLFLNRVSSFKDFCLVWKLLNILSKRNKNSLKVIGGDLVKNRYYEFKAWR